MTRRRLLPLVALSTTAALTLAGCAGGSGTDADPGASASGTGGVAVVASTNVYGDIVETVGGDLVDVTSVIDDPSQDPHSYEADARTQLAVSRADLVVENGGGYDAFVDTLVEASGTDATVLDAVEISGLETADAGDDHADEATGDATAADDHGHSHEGEEGDDHGHEGDDHAHEGHDHGSFNEHVFYSLPSMTALATAVAEALGEIDAANADTYTANAEAFGARVADLQQQADAVRTQHEGESVAYTEPVPGYLFDAMGLVNVTPDDFSEAIEEGDDVSPAALNETLKLFSDGQVDLLAYNEQTSSAETEQVEQAARDAGVAIVPVTELLPEGEDYVSWQQANIDAISAALGA